MSEVLGQCVLFALSTTVSSTVPSESRENGKAFACGEPQGDGKAFLWSICEC